VHALLIAISSVELDYFVKNNGIKGVKLAKIVIKKGCI